MSVYSQMTVQERKIAFKKTLREFIQVVLALSLLGGLAFYLLGAQQPTTRIVHCGAEQLKLHHKDLMYINHGNYITGGKVQSNEFAHTGTYSLQLTNTDRFGFGYNIPALNGNEEFTVSVWRFANGKDHKKGKLVASGPCSFWQAGEEVVEKSDDGWEKIQFTFFPPKKCKGKQIKIYCWNTASYPIYFDDLEIKIKQIYY